MLLSVAPEPSSQLSEVRANVVEKEDMGEG